MAKKTKKVSVNAFEKSAKDGHVASTTLNWRGIEVSVRWSLTLAEVVKFVEEVVNNLYQDSEFIPEVKRFLINRSMVLYYTNITLPANLETCYELLYSCDICEAVRDAISPAQFNDILSAIDERVNYQRQLNVSAVEQKAASLLASVEQLGESMSQLFSGINRDDVANLANALAGHGEVDEAKIVKAILGERVPIEVVGDET